MRILWVDKLTSNFLGNDEWLVKRYNRGRRYSSVYVMIGTKTEKEHDKIVEKVLRRMEENDLFVKPEKYM